MDPYEHWEVHETRGYAMRHGHHKALSRRRNATAPSEQRGRNCFSRSIGCDRDVARCGMCKPGRRQGAGGAKSLKRLGKNGSDASQKQKWLQLKADIRAIMLKGQAPQMTGASFPSYIKQPAVVAAAPAASRNVEPPVPPMAEAIAPPPPPLAVKELDNCSCGCKRGFRGASRKHALRLAVPAQKAVDVALPEVGEEIGLQASACAAGTLSEASSESWALL
eukprot:TRINITY_DN18542_c0_g1_i1.p1 TRINITY_DN18542_c0_g1~~TRINITY_DN18542_c0_g1_i1.p1  ORF type:complete len:243 (-),score=47.08 TRINITY_DN18542_c0_g1_i1:250-912(-)